MEQLSLKVKKRDLLGKKAKKLRREQWVPGNIFGKNIPSFPVMIEEKAFETIYKQAGETGLIELVIEGEKNRPVLIKDVQLNPVTALPLHVDFYQVNLKQKITTTVPLEFIGESQAVKLGTGILLTLVHEIEVECLPEHIPGVIQVSIEGLAELNQALYVKDLPISSEVEIRTEADEMVCKITEAVIKEKVEEVTPVAEEVVVEESKEGEQQVPAKETETKE